MVMCECGEQCADDERVHHNRCFTPSSSHCPLASARIWLTLSSCVCSHARHRSPCCGSGMVGVWISEIVGEPAYAVVLQRVVPRHRDQRYNRLFQSPTQCASVWGTVAAECCDVLHTATAQRDAPPRCVHCGVIAHRCDVTDVVLRAAEGCTH